MRQATEAERRQWLEQTDFVAQGVEVLTALFSGDRDLAKLLADSFPEASAEAHLWPYFYSFLCERNWLTVWDEFCLWLAEMRAEVACGVEIGFLEPEDELDQLVDQEWADQEGDD